MGNIEESIERQQIVYVGQDRYKIVQYKSKTIQVWINGEDPSSTKEGLRQFITATNLNVSLKNSNEEDKVTRTLGDDVLNALEGISLTD